MNLATTSRQSNNRLAERVFHTLQQLSCQRLRTVRCEARGTTIVLHGEARSYYFKQLAQTIAAKVPGVHYVVNKVRVAPTEEPQ